MRYLKGKVSHEIVIQKSTFIAVLMPLEKKEDFSVSMDRIRLEYPKANHYCSASLLGFTAEQQTASDDGEPSRTAGVPILEVLKHYELTDILCVVIRYFGGIKLGAGGLVRAYTKVVADALKQAKFYQKKQVPSYQVRFSYTHIDLLDRHFSSHASILDKTFLEDITYILVLHDDDERIIKEIGHLLIDFKKLEPQTLCIDE
ncbi:MAG: YigZ family protein [Acholeplasmataceae bacterium]|nr:YigZ family protein [Acholeplasmataceae bacterium]